MERVFSSRELQLHYEVEAMAGCGVNRSHPALYNFLLRHLDAAKRERLAKSEETRLRTEARWREIALGERPAQSVLQLNAVIGHPERRAA
jgi:hypothetical protein